MVASYNWQNWLKLVYIKFYRKQIFILIFQFGAIKPMCNLLNSKDIKVVSVVLDGLNNILNAAQKMGETDKVGILIEECGGLDLIESLQTNENEKIYEKALSIIENFFSEVLRSSNYILF